MDLSVLDQFFAFKVGDWVRPKGRMDHPPMLVVSRFLEQCYGGVQAHYNARSSASNGSYANGFIDWTEVELEASEPFLAWAEKNALQSKEWRSLLDTLESCRRKDKPEPKE